jgi:transposase
VDRGYVAQWLREWVWGLKHTHKIDLEVVEHEGQGFKVVKWRWVVERTFAWLLRLSSTWARLRGVDCQQ